MKGIRYVPLTFLLAVTPALAGAGDASSQQALQSLSDILASEGDAPALLGVVPTATGTTAVKDDNAPAARPLVAGDVEKNQLMARLKAQQQRTQQLTATVAQLNARLKTRGSEAALNAQKQAMEEAQKQLLALRAQLSAAEEKQNTQSSDIPVLKTSLDNAKADLKISLETAMSLREQTYALHRENNQLTDEIERQKGLLATAQKALSDQKAAGKPVTHDDIRDYAVGTSLGADVLSLLKARAAAGVSVRPEMALAGIRDMFAGKPSLSPVEIEGALKESSTLLAEREEKEKTAHEQSGRQYMTTFAAKAGVVKDPSGFLSHIDYVGEGDITESDVVSVVMKEMLTDGTVIKDMESSGKWVSQPVNAFPPVFRSAILKMKNHGSVTLVVPPSLAYGDQGYPPTVPPGATMVYSLRIHDVNGH
ncbi:FKBP-type peptidyl-prolyl cis-trans isomerase N-terminal domain-containing protein [Enterobacter asburiae]|uniref:FKBP-type peptidyl-prolyl cis-trans isomerase N-terminal domain-containing protein n=1 Tax=Enterobacter asburiae TaxID=61645 RepID=UPI000F8913B6|nr:FKBP-type peptidyl-prolyl cis-trans isomerase N-terminal domain-containing protein [Enterobacter asburiae]RTP84551.1 hypothetical protein EKN34_22470 [Enterobacter asburiae]